MILLSVEEEESICDSDQIIIEENRTEGFVPLEPNIKVIYMEQNSDSGDNHRQTEQEKPLSPSVPSSNSIEGEANENTWSQWKPASLKTKKHPALCQPKEKRVFDKLGEAKLALVELQKEVLEEELKEKRKKNEILEGEEKQKMEIHELQMKMLREEILHKTSMQKSMKEEQSKLYDLKEKALLLEIEKNKNVCSCNNKTVN
ncbi:uncharacterized protein LOC123313003 [Coccinella septempunctata]|uniref:uncharacterized protein LOC123313003 n=1 Tax=Coccinella septempunctata TaxID=41139 RepID=UPI001D096039|nr:uncharacterized protein LOC123313003 [Coccinella septempunctata]